MLKLLQSGISNVIRCMVRDALASRGDMRDVEPEEIIQDLYRKGLMKTVLENLELTGDLEKELEAKIQAQVNTTMSERHHRHDNFHDEESSIGSPGTKGEKLCFWWLRKKGQHELIFWYFSEHDGSSIDDGVGPKCRESHYQQPATIVEEVPHEKRTKGLLSNTKFHHNLVRLP